MADFQKKQKKLPEPWNAILQILILLILAGLVWLDMVVRHQIMGGS